MKPSYIFLATGFEEIEALATVDVLRRAGMDVKLISISDTLHVAGAHGVTVTADALLSDTDLSDAEWLIAPGGLPGSTNLAACQPLTQALKAQYARGGHVAAICAAPAFVLSPLGILDGRRATGYPGTEDALRAAGALPQNQRVVVDGNVTTGNGPSSAVAFALSIAAQTVGQPAADQVAAAMLL